VPLGISPSMGLPSQINLLTTHLKNITLQKH
jgi:hypothetical protein